VKKRVQTADYYNSLISEEERNIEKYKSAIKAANMRIAEYTENIRNLESGKCPQCNADLPLGSVFCMICGTKIKIPEIPQNSHSTKVNFCESCRAELKPGFAFCTNCGHRVAPGKCQHCGSNKTFMQIDTEVCLVCGAKIEPTENTENTEIIKVAEDTKNSRSSNPDFCDACQAELKPGLTFCTSCGLRIAPGKCQNCGSDRTFMQMGAEFCLDCKSRI